MNGDRQRVTLAVALAAIVLLPSSLAAQTSARIETAPLELKSPDRYQVPALLEPSRRVTLMAQDDGIVRLIAPMIGAKVKQGEVIARMDANEAEALAHVQQARIKVKEAALKAAKEATTSSASAYIALAEAELGVAKTEAELARLRLDRCTLRAPFEGSILSTPIDAGQFVAKGAPIVELADLTSLRVLVPVDRTTVPVGTALPIQIEGKAVTGKVKALVALPEPFSALRELVAPFAAAWIDVPNGDGALQPGLRVRAPGLPTGPITTVAAPALHEAPSRAGALSSFVQVIRAEYVTEVPVLILGEMGPERLQVTGPFRQGDVLIVSSSTPLAARTLIRFGGSPEAAGSIEGQAPSPNAVGSVAQIAPPPNISTNPAVAPIGTPGSAAPTTRPTARPAGAVPAPGARPGTKAAAPASKPATKGSTIVPF